MIWKPYHIRIIVFMLYSMLEIRLCPSFLAQLLFLFHFLQCRLPFMNIKLRKFSTQCCTFTLLDFAIQFLMFAQTLFTSPQHIHTICVRLRAWIPRTKELIHTSDSSSINKHATQDIREVICNTKNIKIKHLKENADVYIYGELGLTEFK